MDIAHLRPEDLPYMCSGTFSDHGGMPIDPVWHISPEGQQTWAWVCDDCLGRCIATARQIGWTLAITWVGGR